MHHWSWQHQQGVPYLTCSLLAPWQHGFFTRQTWPQAPQDLVGVLQPQAAVLRVKQVHGNQVLSAQAIQTYLEQQGTAAENYPEADGLYSDRPQQSVWVCSADCTPALIADARTGQVAAVHAGWRGTAARILPEAIAHLQAQGSHLQDLRVAMGPAIDGCVYQVTTAVAAQVGRSLHLEKISLPQNATDQEILHTLMALTDPPILPDEAPGRVRLDVRRINALQLAQLGIPLEAIAIAPHCTYQDPERFFSYRRDSRRQVQWSGIVSDATTQHKTTPPRT